MIKNYLYLPVILWLTTVTLIAQERVSREEIDSIITARGQADVLIKYPGYKELTEIGRHLSVSGVRNGLATIVLAPGDQEYFFGLNLPAYIEPQLTGKSVVTAASMADAMNWDKYPSYQQYDSIMRKFADDYPGICMLDTIGTSYQGRLILALKISDNVTVDEPEPEVFYTSSMHGDELAGYILMLRLAEHLLQHYSPGTFEERLIDSLEIWINPLANPDGTYRDPDLGSDRDSIFNPTRINANGTDINRSFPAPFTNEQPDNETFNFITFHEKRNFALSANFHSGAEVVNYPWDSWLNILHADDEWFESISRDYADTVHYYSGTGYLNDYNDGIVRGSEWYIIYGGRQDYITYAQHGREVTIELDATKQTPGAQLPLLWEYNYRSMLRYIEKAIYGVHGRVADDDTGLPVPARLFISGYDMDSSQVYSDTLSGNFVRMLPPGTYTILFTADGYFPELVEDLVIVDRQQLWINVHMKKLTQSAGQLQSYGLKIWPVPAKGQLYLQMPPGFEGQSEISIISLLGQSIFTTTGEFFSGVPLQ